MSKLIIHNEVEGLSDWWALWVVQQVVNNGKISKSVLGEQYCYVTNVDIEPFGKLTVYAYKNEQSDGFIIREPPSQPPKIAMSDD